MGKNFISVIFKILLLFIFIFSTVSLHAQQSKIDSLRSLISSTKIDSVKIILYGNLAGAYYDEKKIDSCVFSLKQALALNEKIYHSPLRLYGDFNTIAWRLYDMGNYSESLEYASRCLTFSEQLNDTFSIGLSHLVFGHDYRELGEYRQSLSHYFKAREFFKLFWTSRRRPEDNDYTFLWIGNTYLRMNQLDSALLFTKRGYEDALASSDKFVALLGIRLFGDIYFASGDDETALRYYKQYIPDFTTYKETNRDLSFALNGIAKIFQKRGEIDSSVFYAKKAFANAQQYSDQENLFTAGMILSEYYKGKDDHEAFNYLKIAMQANDSMISSDKLKQAQLLSFTEQVREKQQAAADAKEAAKTRMMIIIAAIVIFLISFLIWNRIRQLRLRNKMILEQKESEKLKAEYEKELLYREAKVLRAQMNPHFIFNCLTSINRYIVKSDHKTASNYLTKFAKLIRLILDNSAEEYISLDAEQQTLKLYIDMELLRFDDIFEYEIINDDALTTENVSIPPMLIQPYVENAIWHGLLHLDDKGKLWVKFKRNGNNSLIVEVEDNGVGRQKAKELEGNDIFKKRSYGMQISKDRIEIINRLYKYKTSVKVFDLEDEQGKSAGTRVVLEIPLLKSNFQSS
jgi:tetratricopeptide (TPR) repeat protein